MKDGGEINDIFARVLLSRERPQAVPYSLARIIKRLRCSLFYLNDKG
jgi:hypothetical protein